MNINRVNDLVEEYFNNECDIRNIESTDQYEDICETLKSCINYNNKEVKFNIIDYLYTKGIELPEGTEDMLDDIICDKAESSLEYLEENYVEDTTDMYDYNYGVED